MFLTFAIGTILGKRWARKLMLILSWFWLVTGILGLFNTLYMWPMLEKLLLAGGQLPPGTLFIIKVVLGFVFTFLFLILPGLFILFYGRQKAKTVFEALDPGESWTDKCPASVLAMSLCSGLGSLFLVLFMPFYHFVIPFLGTFLEDLPGAIVCLALAAALAYAAWGVFHLQMAAWWVQFGTILFWGVSSTWTFSTKNLLDMYEAMQVPEKNMGLLKQSGFFENTQYLATYMGVVFGIYLAYLLFIRKYFRTGN
jgi:hypothetical protein